MLASDERLESLGVKVLNKSITGQVNQDRNVLTGDSPLASNNLGILAADELLKKVAQRLFRLHFY